MGEADERLTDQRTCEMYVTSLTRMYVTSLTRMYVTFHTCEM